MKIKEYFKAGLFTDNPVLIQLLGMCPTLATSTSLVNAI
ncbi:MAG: electron transport complex subunit RsxE, partial [Bacteroidales bacterium]|nr:electron transport complex subunit RsxE [Bacteroidales bacterium]